MRLFGSRTFEFKTRSIERDAEQDREHVLAIARAIDDACRKVEAERTGLQSRLDQVLALASTVGGNDIEDHIERDRARSRFLKDSDVEIARGQERLQLLNEDLDHFKFLKAVLKTRFPRSL